MKIKTEKTHTVVFTDDELNTLRCFIGEAMYDYKVWEECQAYRDDMDVIHNQFVKACMEGKK